MIDLSSNRTIGHQVTVACAELGITVAKLCERAGVEQSNITRWKDMESPAIYTLRKLHNALLTVKAEKSQEAAGLTGPNPEA